MKILVTGFNAFGPVKINPSELIVTRLMRAPPKGIALAAIILPTEYAAATAAIKRAIRRERPDAILCLGVAAGRSNISLERVALNLDDDKLADNAGVIRHGRIISRTGPPLYWSRLPLEAMLYKLLRSRISARISNHAGTYLCNHIFYIARHLTEKHGIPCGFVHVPQLRTLGKKKKQGMTLSTMLRGVDCCLTVIAATGKATGKATEKKRS